MFHSSLACGPVVLLWKRTYCPLMSSRPEMMLGLGEISPEPLSLYVPYLHTGVRTAWLKGQAAALQTTGSARLVQSSMHAEQLW